MARRPTLAEDLADDTGRIRPEVADFVMETAEPQPPPRRRQPVLWEPIPGVAWAFLGLMIFFSLLLLIVVHTLNSNGTKEETQVNNSVTSTAAPSEHITPRTEAPPLSNQEKIENEVNQVTTSKKLEEERAKSTGIEDSSSFNHNQCGIRRESFSPTTHREEIEQPESKETATTPKLEEESESTRQSYQYNPPVRPPRYRYSENSRNFTRWQYGFPYQYGQPYYAPPIIRYRIPVYPNQYYLGPIQGIGRYDYRLGGRRYIVIFRRRFR